MRFRRATPRDRDAVFAFCATTWPGGDYIPLVWDAWLADPQGAFVVGVDGEDAPLAVGKLSLAAPCQGWPGPAEGWLEGLRVAPAQRGRGWGRALVAHLADCAWAQGMQTLRFLTEAGNTPMHHVAAALGFAPGGEYHPHRAEAGGNTVARRARLPEAPALWEGALAALAPAEPLSWRGWTAARATAAWLEAAVAQARVLVAADGRSIAAMTPPGDRGEATVALLAGAPGAFPELLAAARAWAAGAGAAQVFGLLPAAAAPAARADGWTSRTDRPMWLYTHAPRRG